MGSTEVISIVVSQPVLTRSSSESHMRRSSYLQDVERQPVAGRQSEQQLPPMDGGFAAWRLLWAAFVYDILLWGFPLSFGVFQAYYSTIPEFADSRFIPVVGTIASGLGYLGAPFMMAFVQRYQRWRPRMIWVGWAICIGGLVLGSFATTLPVLILSQGVAYGLGFLILCYPITTMINEYWVERRGMAYGLLCGGSGVSGCSVPFILEVLLAKYGYQTTLRAMAVAIALLTGPLMPMIKGRLPTSEQAHAPKIKWTFLKNPLFWVYSVSNVLQGFGYFFPGLYLPSYAASLGLSGKIGALLLALMSISQVCGQFVFGLLSDQIVPLSVLACISTTVAAIACLTMWRLAESLPILIVFAIVYGAFATGFTAIWVRMSTAITDDEITGPIVFSLFNFGKGVGNVIAGPVGGQLVAISRSNNTTPSSSYRWVIVLSGSCMFASTCAICLGRMNHLASWLARKR